MEPLRPDFLPRFARVAAAVRVRLAVRTLAAGTTAGALAAVPIATAAWATGHTHTLPWTSLVALSGTAVGAVVASRTRWRDPAVALFLDARLGSHEAIATALELARRPTVDGTPAHHAVLAAAHGALDRLAPGTLPRALRRAHALALGAVGTVLALGTVSLASLVPHGHPTASGHPTPSYLTLETLPGLEPVERLRELSPPTEAQRLRLERLSDQARALREQLRAGTEPRSATDALNALREDLARERTALGEGTEREGLDAAVARLADAGMNTAAAALAARDLAALDRAMAGAANAREAADRQHAHEALQSAAAAAARAGAPEVARALREEESLLRRREDRNSLLRELARSLGANPDVRRAAEHLDRGSTDASAQALARALEQALATLTPEERARLATQMRQAMAAAQRAQAAQGGQAAQGTQGSAREGSPGNAQAGSAAAQAMTPEALAHALQQMAAGEGNPAGGSGTPGEPGEAGGDGMSLPMPMAGDGGSTQAAIQAALAAAAMGADQAGRQMGAGTRPGPGGHGSQPGGGPDTTPGGGPGSHGGHTAPVAGDALQARARAVVHAGGTVPGGVAGLTAGHAGGVSRVLRTGDLRAAAPDELHGVDRSDVPAAYRDQVRAYFQP